MAERKSEWSKYGEEFCGTVYYDKGDREYHLTAAFNLDAKNIDIWGDRWESNGTPVLVPQDHPTRWSCEYGHFQRFSPTWELEDLEWIVQKAKELFK